MKARFIWAITLAAVVLLSVLVVVPILKRHLAESSRERGQGGLSASNVSLADEKMQGKVTEADTASQDIERPLAAPALPTMMISRDSIDAEAIEALRERIVDDLIVRLRTGDLSILELKRMADDLRLCLEDERGRAAFEYFVNELSQGGPAGQYRLEYAMRAAVKANYEFAKDFTLRAADAHDWEVLSAGICGFKLRRTARVDDPEALKRLLTELVEKAIASGDPGAEYAGVRTMWENESTRYPTVDRKDCERLLMPLLREGSGDSHVDRWVLQAAFENGLMDSDEAFEAVVEWGLSNESADIRLLAQRTWQGSLRQSGWRGESPAERVRVTLEVLATELEGITLALDDSDALVRLDASSRYDALQDQLESVPEMVNKPDALTYH